MPQRNPRVHPRVGDVFADDYCRFKVTRTLNASPVSNCRAGRPGSPGPRVLVVWVKTIGGELHGCTWWMHIHDFTAGMADCRLVRQAYDDPLPRDKRAA